MGLREWLIRREANKVGQEVSEARGDMMGAVNVFLQSNKRWIGAGFLAVAGWAYFQGCPAVLTFDVLAKLHMNCESIQVVLSIVGAFLAGAGVIQSDQFVAAKAGKPAAIEAVNKQLDSGTGS